MRGAGVADHKSQVGCGDQMGQGSGGGGAALVAEKELCMSGKQISFDEPEGEPFKAILSKQRRQAAERIIFCRN